MKKILLSIGMAVVISNQIYAQVGIQTENPKGTLHVDGSADNTGNNLSEDQIKNDVIIKQDGKVGVGVINPVTKVDIKSDNPYEGFKLVDGNEEENKVLTSDAEGKATWKVIKQPTFKVELGTVPNYQFRPTMAEHDAGKFVKYTGAYIDLPEGTSLIQLSLFVKAKAQPNYGGERFIKFVLYDNNGQEPPLNHAVGNSSFSSRSPRLLSFSMHPQMDKGFVNGPLSVTNDTGGVRRYYLYVDTDQSTYYEIKVNPNTGQIYTNLIGKNNDLYYELSEFDIIYNFAETSLFYQTVETP